MSDTTDVGAPTPEDSSGERHTPALTTGAPEPKTALARHYNDLWSLARMTTNTEMVPKALRGRPDAALAVMVYGHELGLPPMTALREVFIIEGTPSCSAKLMRALILRAGHLLQWRKVAQDEVTLYGRRRDNGSYAEVTWTREDADRAGLLGKTNWQKYPRSMLAARASSELARLVFADVVTIGYTPEELGAVGPYAAIDVDYDPATEVVPPEEWDDPDPEYEDGPDPEDIEDEVWREEARDD